MQFFAVAVALTATIHVAMMLTSFRPLSEQRDQSEPVYVNEEIQCS